MGLQENISVGLLMMAASFSAHAGVDSGGGPGIVCTDGIGNVTRAESYDLYEAKVLFGLSINYSNASVSQQLADASARLGKLNYFVRSDFEDALSYILSHQKFLPIGVLIGPGVSDLGPNFPPVVPIGCELEYVGFYQADGTLVISQTVFNRMLPTDQAAFYAHEALYRLARTFGKATDSEIARKLNAFLWSNEKPSQVEQIVSKFTWNQSMFNNSRSLRFPVVAHPNIHAVTMTVSNPEGYNFTPTLECMDDALNVVAQGMPQPSDPTHLILEMPFEPRCKLLSVVIQLHPEMTSNYDMSNIGIVISDLGGPLYEESGPRPEGLAREEIRIPIYK